MTEIADKNEITEAEKWLTQFAAYWIIGLSSLQLPVLVKEMSKIGGDSSM